MDDFTGVFLIFLATVDPVSTLAILSDLPQSPAHKNGLGLPFGRSAIRRSYSCCSFFSGNKGITAW